MADSPGSRPSISEYCRDQLTRGREELSLEELRAQRYFLQREGDVEEKLRRLEEVKAKLSHELEEKRRLLEQRRPRPQGSGVDPAPAAPSFCIFEESVSTATRPSGNSELTDDVFLRPDERGLSLQVHLPRPAGSGGPSVAPQTPLDSGPQKPGSTSELSPIQEMSVDDRDRTSAAGASPTVLSNPQCPESAGGPAGGAVDPCDPDVRQRLLESCDVTSCPGFHRQSGPLPEVGSCLQLGDRLYHIYSRVEDGGTFSIYQGAVEENNVLVKVDRSRVPWDFHQFNRLKRSSSAALPQISCFLYADGCVTVYAVPPEQLLMEMGSCKDSLSRRVVLLLQMVQQLHSCRLMHGALRPSVLICTYRGTMTLDRVFPVDWSSSLDLDLQPDVASLGQVPSAQTYVKLGLLETTSPPELVDLVGVAETVHLLLAGSRMVPTRDADGWTAECFGGDAPRDVSPGTWTAWKTCFRRLLNAGARSSLSVLSEVEQQLSALS